MEQACLEVFWDVFPKSMGSRWQAHEAKKPFFLSVIGQDMCFKMSCVLSSRWCVCVWDDRGVFLSSVW